MERNSIELVQQVCPFNKEKWAVQEKMFVIFPLKAALTLWAIDHMNVGEVALNTEMK